MSFTKGEKITRYSWYEIPITDSVINQVNILGKDQPEHLTFRGGKGRLIGEVELTGLDVELTDTPQKIKTFGEKYLDQSDAIYE